MQRICLLLTYLFTAENLLTGDARYTASGSVVVRIALREGRKKCTVQISCPTVHIRDGLYSQKKEYAPANIYPRKTVYDERSAPTSKTNLEKIDAKLVRYMTTFCCSLATELDSTVTIIDPTLAVR